MLSVTEGAGQHAAGVEPYAGLRMKDVEKMFQDVTNVEKMFQDVEKMFQNVEEMFKVSKC